MNHHYWPTFFTWWTLAWAFLVVVAWLIAWRAKTADKAVWAVPLGVAGGLVGSMPGVLWVGGYWDLPGVMAVILPAASLAVGPMWLVMKKQNREFDAKKQAKADEAEALLRKLGA